MMNVFSPVLHLLLSPYRSYSFNNPISNCIFFEPVRQLRALVYIQENVTCLFLLTDGWGRGLVSAIYVEAVWRRVKRGLKHAMPKYVHRPDKVQLCCIYIYIWRKKKTKSKVKKSEKNDDNNSRIMNET